ncbi:MAG: hypothetical protein QOI18_991, partial [Solirubrobacteraceae bacterium]|nr:hypothetical protein [Solirubrobacteraceae bacterium]
DEDGVDPVQYGEEIFDAPGVATLAPEAFDAAILAALIAP